MHLTAGGQVANCIPLVTTVQLTSGCLPSRLRAVSWGDPLFVRGMLCEGPSVAIVGARAATCKAMDRAHAIARHLGARGIVVVSGGALGIDGAAHRGALAGAGATTVVLGSGVDVAYPKRHEPLFAQVIERGGALVSMFPMGMEPRRSTFLQRNPLIAALADAVIVIEAEVRSGSLSTAAAGKQYDRPIAAWPGSAGCDRLIYGGAAIVENLDDVDALLAGTPRTRSVPVLDPVAQRVREAILAGARDIDQIVHATQLSVPAVLRAIDSMRGMK
jgi:DNA processing protein